MFHPFDPPSDVQPELPSEVGLRPPSEGRTDRPSTTSSCPAPACGGDERLPAARTVLAAFVGAGDYAAARAFCFMLVPVIGYDAASDLSRDFYGRGLCDEE